MNLMEALARTYPPDGKPTCESIIDNMLSHYLQSFRRILRCSQLYQPTEFGEPTEEDINYVWDSDEGLPPSAEELREAALIVWNNLPFEVSVTRTVKVDMSPEPTVEWFECVLTDHGAIKSIEYHFTDKSDHASRELKGDALVLASEFLSRFTDTNL